MLGRIAEVNPAVPEFDEVADEELITFMPLETCWPDGRADTSRRAKKANVVSGYTRFRDGDVILPKITPTFEAGRVFAVSIETEVGAATTEVHILRALPGVDARFISYVCRSQPFLQEGARALQGVGNLRRVSTEWVRSFQVPDRTLGEQRAIADYLDRETAQIDTLIAKQEQLIAALRERRSTAADAEFGPGVGAGHRLKWHLREVDTRAGALSDELPLLSVSITWGVRRRELTGEPETRADELRTYKVARRGDLVINRMRAFQGALGVAQEDGVVSPDYAVLCPDANVDSNWLAAVMRTATFVAEMTARLKGIGNVESGAVRTPRINVSDLLGIRLIVPSIHCQQRDVDAHRSNVRRIDNLIAKAERFIELAKERRAALITAAVTGQIDVHAA